MKRAEGKHDAHRHLFMRLMHTCRGGILSIRVKRCRRLGPATVNLYTSHCRTQGQLLWVQVRLLLSDGQPSSSLFAQVDHSAVKSVIEIRSHFTTYTLALLEKSFFLWCNHVFVWEQENPCPTFLLLYHLPSTVFSSNRSDSRSTVGYCLPFICLLH